MSRPRPVVLVAFALVCFQGAGQLEAAQIEAGMSEEEVVATLGEPMGTIRLRDKSLLLYPRGEITVIDGRVSAVDLTDPEAFEAEQARLEKERAEWAMEQEKLRIIREKEGRELKAEKLQSSAFAALPVEDRLRYWRNFQNRYPETDVTEEIVAARESYDAEIEALQRQKEVEELRREVAEARREAAAARAETERLRRQLNDRDNRRYYGYPVYPYPYPYPQRTIQIYGKPHDHKGRPPGDHGDRGDHNGRPDRSEDEPEEAPVENPPGSIGTRELPATPRLPELPGSRWP